MPRPPKETAIGRIKLQYDTIPGLKQLKYGSPDFVEWRRDTRVAIAYAFGELSPQVKEFEHIQYSPTVFSIRARALQFQEAYIRGLDAAAAILRSMMKEIGENWEDESLRQSPVDSSQVPQTTITNRVFVIHGRDHGTRDSLARFLERLELEVVILEEQPDRGLTVIEKFEEYATGGFVVALLTPDDIGGLSNGELQPRARQNVIFELGYFVGKLGRNRVPALVKGDIEIPSDYAGVLYIPMDESSGWKMKLIREMRDAGMDIDANRAP